MSSRSLAAPFTPLTADVIAFSCLSCGMKLTVPAAHAGVSGPCPCCGTTITAPQPRAVARTPVERPHGFLRDLREADQWSASLSSHRLPDGPEADATPIPAAVAAPVVQRQVFAALAGTPVVAPQPIPEGPSVEELLRNVQYTVVERNTGRATLIYISLAIIIAVPGAVFGPRLFNQLQEKATAMLHPPKPPPASPAKTATSSPQRKDPAVDRERSNGAAVSTSSPFKGSPSVSRTPARQSQVWNSGPRQVMAPNGVMRRGPSGQPAFAQPSWQQRAPVVFAPAPRVAPVRFPTSSGGGGGGGSGGYTGYAIPYEYADAGTPAPFAEPPAIGYITSNDDAFAASMHQVQSPNDETPEWMRLPADQWPPIMLHNDGSFRSQAYVQGSPCFLIETAPEDLWLACATVLLGEQAGVVPPVTPTDLQRNLVRWNAILPSHGNSVAEIKSGRTFIERHNADCVLMKVPDASKASVVKALRLRSNNVAAGEPLYLVALSPDGATQLVFSTTVMSSSGSSFRITLDNPTETSGFIGGAVVDVNGRLAGILTSTSGRGQGTAVAASELTSLIRK